MLTKELIDKFYEDVESLGLKFPVSAIHKATGFGKPTISQYLSRKLPPSENFINSFYKSFEKSLKNVQQPENGIVRPQEAQHGDKSEILALMRERLDDLKQDKEWFKKQMETSLAGLHVGQKSILAHVATILEKDDERDAAGNKRKEQSLKDETGKRIVDKISAVSQMDNSVGR